MRRIGNAVLFVVEFCFKLAAPLAAVISMAAPGGFVYKVISGFESLPEAIREIIWWVRNVSEIGVIIEDYNTMTAANFNQKYGAGAINSVMEYLNELVSYIQQVYVNLAEQPITTILAALLVFLIFYLGARVARFIRQRGQGSVVTKFERKMGNRVFSDQPSSKPYDPNRWS